MIPKRIVIENFLSFGKPGVTLCFSDEPLWVFSGPNGVGKSAVFDAITYALFGTHRGGATNSDKLVRHGTNRFRVVFEFEFADAEYRITRTRPASGRPTQKVERHAGDGRWEAIDLPGAADVGKWSEKTLGLGSAAFAASVLLRQGNYDTLVSGKGKERLD